MTDPQPSQFLAGVIEGFYGAPWPQAERLELLDQLPVWGLNTYLYAPKDDLNHRAAWRECYGPDQAETLRQLASRCQSNQVRFIYALSPGLDICYSNPDELTCLQRRLQQLITFGCDHFALLFDDIPDQINPADQSRWHSLAAAQSHVANSLYAWAQQQLPSVRFLFCPTPYCGRMALRGLGGPDYLPVLGQQLHPQIDVFWTGPEIISQEIPLQGIRELQKLLRRKPVIWDNLHANDYDGRRFYCGPYSGRSLKLRAEVRGLLSNPNNELPLNHVPLQTLGAFVHCQQAWNPRPEYQQAMSDWLDRFSTTGQPVALEDLMLLGDCFYLPHEDGPDAQRLFALAEQLVQTPPAKWKEEAAQFLDQSARLRKLCTQLTELKQRSLFHALSRRLWELREELDLFENFVRWGQGDRTTPFASDAHLPGTYRGGFVPRLQRLLIQQPDGTFTSAPHGSRTG